MKLPWVAREGIAGGLALALLVPLPVTAADWTATAGDMGREASRYALHIGGSWGAVNGSEVEKVEPSRGFEGGFTMRIWRSFSVYGSYAASKANVDGQVVQLLDQPVRADGRSGNVSGELSFRRFRAGLRLDGLYQEDWPVRAYFIGAAVFTTNEVKIDTVDQRPSGTVPKPGGGTVDLSKFDDTQTGLMGRVGAEYRVTSRVGVDLGFTYEVFEPPPGTNATTAVTGGVTFRI